MSYVELHKHSDETHFFDLYEPYRVVGRKPRWELQDRGFETPCWIWLMYCEPKFGYGYSKALGTPVHRALYKLLVRALPRWIVLHHRCEQSACINPGHLQEQAEHNALHKTGRKMNLSDAERERRRESCRRVGVEFGAKLAYTKQSRSEVAKRTWAARKAA